MKRQRPGLIGLALVAAAVALSCDGEPTAPGASIPPPVVDVNINGLWDWTETYGGCTNTGSYAFSQTDSTFVGGFGQAGNNCSGFPDDIEGTVSEGVVRGNSVSFRVSFSGASCRYIGSVSGNPPSSIVGTGVRESCGGASVTWRAYRGSPVASVSVEPSLGTVVVNWALRLKTELRNATGDRLFERPVAWSSDNLAVATVSATGLVTGVSAGTAAITASAEGVSAQATITALSIADLPIAFESPRGIEVMRADGSGRTVLTRTGVLEPTWSTDGARLSVTVMSGFALSWWEMCAIYTVRADGSDVRPISSSAECDHSPAWSPDGTKIAFGRGDPACFWYCAVTIYVVDANGSNAVELAGTGTGWNTRPAWSPDGTKLAFESYDRSTDHYDIYVMNADGSGVVNLTNDPGFNTDPAWSTDGALAFVRDGDIWSMNADGSGATNLTPNFGFESNPAWSPDGAQIVFVSATENGCWYPDPPCRHPGSDLYLINRDGTGLRRLTSTDEYEANPAWPPGAAAARTTERNRSRGSLRGFGAPVRPCGGTFNPRANTRSKLKRRD